LRVAVAGYGLVVALYLATRLALLWRFPPFIDEGIFASWTLRGYEDADSRFVPLASGQLPALEWLGMTVMRLGVEPLTALRLVSVAAGLLTLGLVSYLARRLGGDRVGLTAAALFTVAPFPLVYSTIGLYDPLATAIVASALVLQILIAERPRLGLALLLGLVLGLGLLTKQTTLVGVALIPLSLLLLDWQRTGRIRRLVAWGGSMVLALALAGIVRSILRLSELYDDLGGAEQALLGKRSLGSGVSSPGSGVAENLAPYGHAVLGYMTLPLLAAAAVGVVVGLASTPRRPLTLYLVLWAGLSFGAVVLLAKAPFVRWIYVSVPPLVVLSAFGVVACGEALRGWKRLPLSSRRWVVPAVALVLVLPAAWSSARILVDPAAARYPSTDDRLFVRSNMGGVPWAPLVGELRRLAGADPLTIGTKGYGIDYVPLALRHRTNLRFVDLIVANPDDALLAFTNGMPAPGPSGHLVWRPLRTFERPRGGVPVILYERGVLLGGRVATTPDALRALVGGGDREFDQYLSTRPDVKTWYVAWHTAHPPVSS